MSSLPMQNGALRHHIVAMRQSLLDEGFLDQQLSQLEKLGDDNPNFVEEVFTLFYSDTTKLLETVEILLELYPNDSPQVDRLLRQLTGSSASIGAIKIKNKASETRRLFAAQNIEGTRTRFQELKREHEALRVKIETYFQLMRHADPEEPAMPPVEGTMTPNTLTREEPTTPPSEGGNSLANGDDE